MLEPWTRIEPPQAEVCPLCQRILLAQQRGNTVMKKRWVAAIAAAAAAVVTTLTESVVLGETVASLIGNLLG